MIGESSHLNRRDFMAKVSAVAASTLPVGAGTFSLLRGRTNSQERG